VGTILDPSGNAKVRYCPIASGDRVGSELIECTVYAGENAKNGNSGSFRYYRIAQLA
jgi:hypothetical protein